MSPWRIEIDGRALHADIRQPLEAHEWEGLLDGIRAIQGVEKVVLLVPPAVEHGLNRELLLEALTESLRARGVAVRTERVI